jgi:hypothetical protein
MSTFRPGTRSRRVLFTGAIVGGPILLFAVAYSYLASLGSVRERLQFDRETLTRELEVLAESPRYPELTRNADSLLRSRVDELFSGPDEVAAVASLSSYVTNAARARRIEVHESDTRAATLVSPGVLRLRVQVSGMTDLQGLLEFLQALEQGNRKTRVDELAIQQTDPATINTAPDEEVLSFTALVSGFALVDHEGRQSVSPTTVGGNS